MRANLDSSKTSCMCSLHFICLNLHYRRRLCHWLQSCKWWTISRDVFRWWRFQKYSGGYHPWKARR